MKKSAIDVIMPVYNGERFIEEGYCIFCADDKWPVDKLSILLLYFRDSGIFKNITQNYKTKKRKSVQPIYAAN